MTELEEYQKTIDSFVEIISSYSKMVHDLCDRVSELTEKNHELLLASADNNSHTTSRENT